MIFLLGSALAGMQQVEEITGRYTLSVDGGGHNSSSSYSITLNKPNASATVYAVYAFAAGTTFRGDPGSTALTINGTTPTLGTRAVDSSGNTYVRYADVTSSFSTTLDSLGAGSFTWTVTESGSAYNIDGSGFIVIWNDSSAEPTTLALMLGSESIYSGTNVTLNVSEIDKTVPDFDMNAGIAISYSTGTGGQYARVRCNGSTVTSNAGGYDDGTYGNGGLITVGGDGDASSNEVYDIDSYVSTGATTVSFSVEVAKS